MSKKALSGCGCLTLCAIVSIIIVSLFADQPDVKVTSTPRATITPVPTSTTVAADEETYIRANLPGNWKCLLLGPVHIEWEDYNLLQVRSTAGTEWWDVTSGPHPLHGLFFVDEDGTTIGVTLTDTNTLVMLDMDQLVEQAEVIPLICERTD